MVNVLLNENRNDNKPRKILIWIVRLHNETHQLTPGGAGSQNSALLLSNHSFLLPVSLLYCFPGQLQLLHLEALCY